MGNLKIKLKIFTIVFLILFVLAPLSTVSAYELKINYPKRANYFLSWELTEIQARDLAKWDIVILDMEHAVRNPDKIRLMRALNPAIIILAYITSQEIRDDALNQQIFTPLRYELAQKISPDWNLKRPDGSLIRFWPGAHVLNLTTSAPAVGGMRWYDTLGTFISNRILANGLWDGVFLDNTWNSLTGQIGGSIDINGDGLADSLDNIDRAYTDGFNQLVQIIRTQTADKYLIVGNDGERFTEFNAMMFENFPRARGWGAFMKQYTNFPEKANLPAFSIINANTNNTGNALQFQTMRFGLASALLGDGYYSFDFGDQNHGQTWWYDEYEAALGVPMSAPYIMKTGSTNFLSKGVWRRDFSQGLVLVNTGDNDEQIDLNADFEKIKGTQDSAVNTGEIINNLRIAANDGVILLRPLQELKGAPYVNGSFIRLYNADGTSARNGFFSYDDSFLGGQTIARLDVDNDGTLETIAIDHNRAYVYKDSVLVSTIYPFGQKWRGELSIAPVNSNDERGIYFVFGQKSNGGKVAVTTWNGDVITSPFEAIKQGFKKGVTVSAGHLSNNVQTEIGVASASSSSLVRVFSLRGKLLSGGWYAFGKKDTNGVSIAMGDVNGDGRAEIITSRARGKPEVIVFDSRGKILSKFVAGSSVSKQGVDVAVYHLDNSLRGNIITSSRSCFFCGR